MISGANALVEPGRIHPIFLEGKLLPLQAKAAAELGLKDGQVVQGNVRLQHDQPMLMLQGKAFAVPGLLASQVIFTCVPYCLIALQAQCQFSTAATFSIWSTGCVVKPS